MERCGGPNKNVNPSFDEPESFVLEVQRGIIHANIGDISHYLNTGAVAGSPLTNISLSGNGNQISVHGTIHKLHIPLPSDWMEQSLLRRVAASICMWTGCPC